MVALLSVADVMVGHGTMELHSLMTVGIECQSIGSQGGVRRSRHNYHNKPQKWSNNQSVLTFTDFWQQLINHRILRNKIKELPTKESLDIYREKNPRTDVHKINLS